MQLHQTPLEWQAATKPDHPSLHKLRVNLSLQEVNDPVTSNPKSGINTENSHDQQDSSFSCHRLDNQRNRTGTLNKFGTCMINKPRQLVGLTFVP